MLTVLRPGCVPSWFPVCASRFTWKPSGQREGRFPDTWVPGRSCLLALHLGDGHTVGKYIAGTGRGHYHPSMTGKNKHHRQALWRPLLLYGISGYLSHLLSYSACSPWPGYRRQAMVINTVAELLWKAGP